MADETDELTSLNAQVEVPHNYLRTFWGRIDLAEVRKLNVIAHSIWMVSCLISVRRTGVRRPPRARGNDRSSGSISGRINFRVVTGCCLLRELRRKSLTSRRNCLKCGS